MHCLKRGGFVLNSLSATYVKITAVYGAGSSTKGFDERCLKVGWKIVTVGSENTVLSFYSPCYNGPDTENVEKSGEKMYNQAALEAVPLCVLDEKEKKNQSLGIVNILFRF